jgi:hypothetical protein
MAYGLRQRDAAGNILVDTTTRLSIVVHTTTISANGSYTNAAFTNGALFAIATNITGTPSAPPIFSLSGTTVTWTFTTGIPIQPHLIILGTY